MNSRKPFVAVLSAGLVFAGAAHSASSWLVSSSPTGLVYSTYANQNQTNAVNKVPDFSMAGYKGGGVAIPFVPAKITVSPSGGDDTAAIQSAINTVSAMPIGTDGFRGAVLLEAGDYTVSSTLTISTSGVVVRGAGSQESGGTKITYSATRQSDVFSISGGSGPSEIGGTRVDIADSFVPVGARTLTLANASGLSPGDKIIVQNTVNQQWLDDMSNMSQWGWTPGGYQLTFRRVITAVNGNTISIDAPIVQTIEDQYGGGDVYKYSANLLENIGIEALRVESTYFNIADEQHGRFAVKINTLQNGWVRQVTAKHFVQGAVSISGNSQYITVEDCAALDHISMISGGRRYSFSINDSQHLLVQRCLTREGRHDYVSGSRTPGPNAFVDCRADNTYADIGPHHRYATGQIYDNIMGGAINGGKNSRAGGSGHGWTGAQILLWNCDATTLRVDAPNGAMNWCIGSSGTQVTDGGGEPLGIWDSHNIPVTPRSLYYTQLTERLGTNAMNSVILPKQKTGTIWTELHEWDGNGLFLDELIVLADEENIPAAGDPLTIRGIVRNLGMLDNGAAISWRKVYGPGEAAFADDTALETTVSFNQDGVYLLELSVDDGISVVRDSVTVQVGSGSADATAPAVPVNPAAVADASSVSLNWTDNAETDLAGYDVFRSTVSGEAGSALAYGLTSSEYTDVSPEKGILYYYTVRAADTNSNVSARSAEVPAMVNALPTVKIVDPFDGETVNYGGSLTVSVDASDKGGLIVNVELFLDGQSAGQDTSAPYEWGAEPLLQNVAVGTHILKAVATDDQGTSSTNSISITVEVDSTPPAVPSGLFALANYEWVGLDWADNTERDLAGYNIYRSTVPGSYGAALTHVTGSSYDDLGLTGGTPYYYRITATDTNGFESAPGSEVSITPKTVPPGMTLFGTNNDGLGGFTHTAADSTQIWSTRVSSVQYRNQNTDQRNASLLRAYPLDRSDGNSYTIEGVITLTDGYPEDNARVGLYLFGNSAQIPGDTEAGTLYIQRNFEGAYFTITQGIHLGTIAEAYHGRDKDYTWFEEETIKISVDITFNGSNIDIVATLTDGLGDSTTVTASVLAADYTGDYFGFVTRSRTRDFGAEPPTIKSAPFTMDYRSFWVAESDDTAPAAPSGLAATAGNGLVSLDWNDNAESDVDTYTVYRSTVSGSYEDALAGGLSASEYTDYTADNGVTYYYKVTASDYHANESSQSAEVFATPAASVDATPPAAPAGLSATAGDGSVSLDWDNNPEGDLHSYSVYRSTTSGSYGNALISGLPSSVYTDHSAVNGTTYYYKVTAFDISGNESTESAEVFATPAEGIAFSDVTIFGSDNDGYGGFTQSITNEYNHWTDPVPANSVEFTQSNTLADPDGTLANNSLLRSFSIDRSVGKSYTITGALTWSCEADRNNRQGIYLFGSSSTIIDENVSGSISLQYDTDVGLMRIRENLNGATLADLSPANGVKGGSGYYTDIQLAYESVIQFVDIGGTNKIDITFNLIDQFAGTGIFATNTLSVIVNAVDYSGDWFGFAGRTRNDGAGDSIVNYESFSIVESGAPALAGYEKWLSDNGVEDTAANFYEYAMASDPTDGLASTNNPTFTKADSGFLYVHPQRSDDTSLIYTVEISTNLVSGLWTNIGTTVTGTNVTGGTLNFVTNEVDTAAAEKFIRLNIRR